MSGPSPEKTDPVRLIRRHSKAASGQRRFGWGSAGCFILLLVGLKVSAGHVLQVSGWHVRSNENAGLMEANAWRNGRMDLSHRVRDTALYQDKVYNVYPPLFTFISYAATTLGAKQGVPEGEFFRAWYVALMVLPLPIVGFWAFQQVLGRPVWSVVLTGYWLIGTPMLPVLAACWTGSINHTNHILASVGLMLIGGDLLGRRRLWIAAIGLVIGVWTRQLTVAYGLAALWMAWTATERRGWKVGVVLLGLGLSVGTLLVLNRLKFDSPFESGYALIYEGRDADVIYAAPAREYGLFHPHFVGRNAWYMNLAPPRFRDSPAFIQQANDSNGVSIWITSPLLLAGFFGVRHWWRDRASRVLMAASLCVIAATLMYHNVGTVQVGFFRFALDFVPIWLLVAAPWAVVGWRRPAILGCLAWSALYFNMLA